MTTEAKPTTPVVGQWFVDEHSPLRFWIRRIRPDGSVETVVEDVGSLELAQRIVVCANACRDFTTKRLLEYGRSITPLPIDVPDGDVLAQAIAWRRVWAALSELGLLQFFNGTMKGGADRAVEFIQELGRRPAAAAPGPDIELANQALAELDSQESA